MERWHLGFNGGGVENIVWYDEPTGHLYCSDIQRGGVNAAILDENAHWRSTESDRIHNNAPGSPEGRKIASIPITMWQNWRREWKAHHADQWTWQTFELMKLADPDNANLLTTDKAIPTHGPRDRPQMV